MGASYHCRKYGSIMLWYECSNTELVTELVEKAAVKTRS
jgi:hypothetical protein